MPENTTPRLQSLLDIDADLVDRIFDYLLAEFPQLAGAQISKAKEAVRDEFAGDRGYVRSAKAQASRTLARDVLALFNGRNATEVARSLQVSRATVYRVLKQAGREDGGAAKNVSRSA